MCYLNYGIWILVLLIIGSNLLFNEIEYFTYLNLWLVSLIFWLILFFLLLRSALLLHSTIYLNDTWMEFFLSLFSVWFLWLIISPSLILLLDFDLILIPSFIIYSLGYQWAWSFNLSFTVSFLKQSSYSFDHYMISNACYSSVSLSAISWRFIHDFQRFNQLQQSFSLIDLATATRYTAINNCECHSKCFSLNVLRNGMNFGLMGLMPFYLFDINRFLLFPLWSSFKIIVFSFMWFIL